MEKRPFDIEVAIERIRDAVRPYPQAALFVLADEGYNSAFEQLVACILSIRTLDEVMLVTARRLFARARTPEQFLKLTPEELGALIRASNFYEAKVPNLLALAQRVQEEYGGTLPCDEQVLLSFKGVGPKCAHLVMAIACNQPSIAVDVHVHRITNRWGYVHTRSPEETMAILETKLPQRYWVDINRLLVPFGKHVCTGTRPHCSTCPVLEMCRQVGVTDPQ